MFMALTGRWFVMKGEYFYNLIREVFQDTLRNENPQGAIVIDYRGLEVYGSIDNNAPAVSYTSDEQKFCLAIPIDIDRKFIHLTSCAHNPKMFSYRMKKQIRLDDILRFGRKELSEISDVSLDRYEPAQWFCAPPFKRRHVKTEPLHRKGHAYAVHF